jgi:hypothetical protein
MPSTKECTAGVLPWQKNRDRATQENRERGFIRAGAIAIIHAANA